MQASFQNQKGITLVELLAALALFGIVLTIVTSVLVQSIKYNDRSENNVNLRQQANYVVTTLRNYNPGDEKYTICLNENGNLEIDDKLIKLNPTITYKTIKINDNDLLDSTNCSEDITSKEAFDFHFILEEGRFNQSFTLTTTITRLTAFKTKQSPPSEGDEDNGDSDDENNDNGNNGENDNDNNNDDNDEEDWSFWDWFFNLFDWIWG